MIHAPTEPMRAAARRAGRIACLAAAAVLLSACGNARETLGISRPPPDEFQVVTRAPLSMPPDFALRPPAPGAPPAAQQDVRLQAQTAVFGPGGVGDRAGPVPVAPGGGVSPGEAAILTRAGAGSAPADIRAAVDRETRSLADADRRFVDRLIFWQDPPPPGTVVDPAAEARRLRENAAAGRPLADGEVPIIERRRRAPLEGLFGRR